MKKRIISVLLVFLLILSVFPTSALATESLSNFVAKNIYVNGQFTDVPTTVWFAENVATAYELGLMVGNSDTYFNATGNVRISEAIAMAARLHSIYTTGSDEFEVSTPWYKTYVDYALANGIISRGYADYTKDASRAEFATILCGALPAEALQSINSIEDGSIPDVQMNTSYAVYVYSLYRAGILTGNDSVGTFTPDSTIQRNAAAAIVTRMAATGLRKTFKLSTSLTAEGIFVKCSTAVFYIEIYDKGGNALASGSGFFISSSGVAVTNYHVIDGAYSAKIKTSNGETHDVLGVYDYSTGNDLALLQIDGSGFSYLDVGYSAQIVTGSTIYAIGSPLGLDNTISSGIVSNSSRNLDGINYIQITASISHGSSGGALLNTNGQVIGCNNWASHRV